MIHVFWATVEKTIPVTTLWCFKSMIPSQEYIAHNGATLKFYDGIYSLDQTPHVQKIAEIPLEAGEDEAYKLFKWQNATAAYPASRTRPDLLCHTSRYAQVTRDNFFRRLRKSFNKFVRMCCQNAQVPLRYVPVNMDTAKIEVYTDASFSSVDENKSQIGIVVLLRDSEGNSNLIRASSVCSRCLARTV